MKSKHIFDKEGIILIFIFLIIIFAIIFEKFVVDKSKLKEIEINNQIYNCYLLSKDLPNCIEDATKNIKNENQFLYKKIKNKWENYTLQK